MAVAVGETRADCVGIVDDGDQWAHPAGRGRQSSRRLAIVRPVGRFDGLADRDAEFRVPTARGDAFAHGGGGPDPRARPKPGVPRDMFTPDLHIDTREVKSRNLR